MANVGLCFDRLLFTIFFRANGSVRIVLCKWSEFAKITTGKCKISKTFASTAPVTWERFATNITNRSVLSKIIESLEVLISFPPPDVQNKGLLYKPAPARQRELHFPEATVAQIQRPKLSENARDKTIYQTHAPQSHGELASLVPRLDCLQAGSRRASAFDRVGPERRPSSGLAFV